MAKTKRPRKNKGANKDTGDLDRIDFEIKLKVMEDKFNKLYERVLGALDELTERMESMDSGIVGIDGIEGLLVNTHMSGGEIRREVKDSGGNTVWMRPSSYTGGELSIAISKIVITMCGGIPTMPGEIMEPISICIRNNGESIYDLELEKEDLIEREGQADNNEHIYVYRPKTPLVVKDCKGNEIEVTVNLYHNELIREVEVVYYKIMTKKKAEDQHSSKDNSIRFVLPYDRPPKSWPRAANP